MHTIFLHAWAHNSANLGRIGDIEISKESGGHAGYDYIVSACARQHAHMLACMHTIFLHAWINLGQIWLDQRDQCIYGIRRT